MGMGKVYDIMNRLTNNKPVIKIDETHEYEVKNSKNTVILLKQISEDKNINEYDKIDKIIETTLGKEALDYINSLELSVVALSIIVNAIIAAVNEVEIEEIEAEAKKQSQNFRKK